MNSSDILNLFSSQTIGTSSIPLVLFSVVLAFAVGLGIAAVYRLNFRGVMYSSNFTLTLVLMTLITTPVVMCIRESIQLSMGMVGALSIVRFRTAVKDPLDTAYMFWALTMGILLGAGQFLLTAVAGVAIAVLITLVCKWRVKNQNCYLAGAAHERGRRKARRAGGEWHPLPALAHQDRHAGRHRGHL